MSVKGAAIQVLRDADGALSAQKISDRILAEGLWQTSGKTPHANVAARLYSDIKKHGEASPFVQVGKNMFGLHDGVVVPESPAPKPTKKTSAKPQPTAKYSFTDAAEKVLEQFGDKKPMHYREVTEKALELGWIITTGDFSPRARAEAARPNTVPVALMNGEQLVALLADKRIGITRNSHDIFELAADDDLSAAPETSGS